MPDGKRVITAVTEVQGMEGDVILLQDIFKFRPLPGSPSAGELVPTGLRPKFLDKLKDADIEVPAAAFKSPINPTDRMAAAGIRNRRVTVPSQRDVVEREELR
jgi:pilus assembly protein CpaF